MALRHMRGLLDSVGIANMHSLFSVLVKLVMSRLLNRYMKEKSQHLAPVLCNPKYSLAVPLFRQEW